MVWLTNADRRKIAKDFLSLLRTHSPEGVWYYAYTKQPASFDETDLAWAFQRGAIKVRRNRQQGHISIYTHVIVPQFRADGSWWNPQRSIPVHHVSSFKHIVSNYYGVPCIPLFIQHRIPDQPQVLGET